MFRKPSFYPLNYEAFSISHLAGLGVGQTVAGSF